MSMVDIIVPVYNAGDRLHACVRSILRQTYSDWTLLLIDDGSIDNSLLLCSRYGERDSRIRCHTGPHSGSISARRRGVELSSAPYVVFVDADDWIDERLLERLLSAASDGGADITVCNMYRVMNGAAWPRKSNASRYFKREETYAGERLRNELVPAFLHGHSFPAQLHGKLYKRELLLSSGNYNSRITFFGDDLFLNLEMFLKAEAVKIIPDILYYYRTGGFTGRFMPHLFHDMVNGFWIQKEVVEAYYPHHADMHYYGIRVMLLNTLRTCLKNLFAAPMSDNDRIAAIQRYCAHPAVLECASDERASGYFSQSFITAITGGDSDYLYKLGKWDYQKSLPKKFLMYAIAKISF